MQRNNQRRSAPHFVMHEFKLGFKGSRNYITGTDLFNATTAHIRESSDSAFVSHLAFRHFARRCCGLCWEQPADDATLIGRGRARFPEGDRAFWIIETDNDATGRRPYDEDGIVSPAIVTGDSIELTTRSEYTAIDEVIALTKRLSYDASPDINGKWLFGQISMTGPMPAEYDSLRIRTISEVPGRFRVHEIQFDGNVLGDVRFIVGSP